MGSGDEEEDVGKSRSGGGGAKSWILVCLGSFTLSLVGVVILTWWELNYHPNNDQQWMVPLGLILLATPLIILSAAFASGFCNDRAEHRQPIP